MILSVCRNGYDVSFLAVSFGRLFFEQVVGHVCGSPAAVTHGEDHGCSSPDDVTAGEDVCA